MKPFTYLHNINDPLYLNDPLYPSVPDTLYGRHADGSPATDREAAGQLAFTQTNFYSGAPAVLEPIGNPVKRTISILLIGHPGSLLGSLWFRDRFLDGENRDTWIELGKVREVLLAGADAKLTVDYDDASFRKLAIARKALDDNATS